MNSTYAPFIALYATATSELTPENLSGITAEGTELVAGGVKAQAKPL